MRLAISNHDLGNSGGIERYALTAGRGLHGRRQRPTFIAKRFAPPCPRWPGSTRYAFA